MNTTMTKKGLVLRLLKDSGITQEAITALVQQALDCNIEELAKGNSVTFSNFGMFEVTVRKAKIGRNPRKPGTEIPIPA